MKKFTLCLTVFALVVITSQASAQTTTKKETRKEIKIEDEDGDKTLTIETTENGKTTKEVFIGADADKKIAELEKEQSGTTKTMFIGEDGKQHLKVEQRIVIKEEIEE